MANQAVKELTIDQRDQWDAFVASNPYGDVLQSWEWGDVKSAGGDWRPLCMAAFGSDGQIAAGALILRRTLPLVGTIYYAPRGPLMADWSDTALLADLIAALGERAKQDGAILLKIDPAIEADDHNAAASLEALGFAQPAGLDPQGFGGTQPRCVMMLDIAVKSEDELLMDCKPQCRRNVRIAQKKGVEVIEADSKEQLAPFYEILKVTAERDGFTVRGLAYYETLWDSLAPRGMGKVFLTRYEGQYLSGAFCFVIGDKCWYVYGASSNEHRNVMPNYAMQWAMITWAKHHGCAIYDFRGVSPRRREEGENAADIEAEDHLQGLNRFKEGFGARYVEYMGERDLVYSQAKYWMYNQALPAARKIARKVRGK